MFNLKTFYKSKQWESFRNQLINERYDDNGYIVCADCGKPIVRRYDIIAHHIEELTEDNVNDVTVSLNPDNIKLICFNCHNKEHERFGFHKQLPKAERHVYIVYSPLCFKALEYVEGASTPKLRLCSRSPTVSASWPRPCLALADSGFVLERPGLARNFRFGTILQENRLRRVRFFRFGTILLAVPRFWRTFVLRFA